MVNRGKCFIDRLPPEILSCIFMEVSYSSISRWELIEHVCRLWRRIVLSMSNLWTSIKVTTNFNLDKLRLELSRSGSLPLDIALILRPENLVGLEIHTPILTRKLSEALELLKLQLHRWKSLEFDSFHSQYMKVFLEFLSWCPPPPQLQKLAISGKAFPFGVDDHAMRYPPSIPPFDHASLPLLRQVYLEGIEAPKRGWKFLRNLIC
jgi:hypothetical protein